MMRIRLAKALAILAALAIACIAFAAPQEPDGAGVESARAAVLGDSAAEVQAGVPEGFEEEVVSLEGRRDVQVGAQGTVIGYGAEGDAPSAFCQLADRLAERGWTAVESGSDSAGSFVKSGGTYTWVFVNCVQVGEGASVVMFAPKAG